MKNNAIKSADKLLEELKQAREIIDTARRATKDEFLRDNLELGIDSKNDNFLSNDIKLSKLTMVPLKRIGK